MAGFCCQTGTGTPEDLEAAVRWYGMAAEQGYTEAEYSLGSAYIFGWGVKENKEEAFD